MKLFGRKKKEQAPVQEKSNGILRIENIRLNQKAENSDQAIKSIGRQLVDAGYVTEGYINGMLNRDHSLTTYIGNDIAIPHGEYEVKNCVKQTGLAVDIYPDGIQWADGTARIVIGIASTTDEHVSILQNIAVKLGDMETVEKVVNGDQKTIHELLCFE